MSFIKFKLHQQHVFLVVLWWTYGEAQLAARREEASRLEHKADDERQWREIIIKKNGTENELVNDTCWLRSMVVLARVENWLCRRYWWYIFLKIIGSSWTDVETGSIHGIGEDEVRKPWWFIISKGIWGFLSLNFGLGYFGWILVILLSNLVLFV